MIEKLMIALHLKQRSSPKVEVEEDSDVSYSQKHTTLMRFHGLSSNFKLHLKMKAVNVCVLPAVMYLSICRKLSFRAAILQLLLGLVQILSVIYYGRCRLTLKQRHSCHRERTYVAIVFG